MKSDTVKEGNDYNFSTEERPDDFDTDGAEEVEEHIR